MPEPETKRMLLVFAHPDDESFGMAGSIARYVNEGVEVSLICATNGDVGSADPEYLEKHDSMTALRLAELNCAAEVLGLKEVITYGYRDSGVAGSPDNTHPNCLAQADVNEVAKRVTEAVRRIRPQVIVTFDPYGGYGHPDHIMMQKSTMIAFNAASDPNQYPEQIKAGLEPHIPQKLYYRTRSRGLLSLEVKLMPLFGQDPRRIGRNKDIDLVKITEQKFPIHTRVNTRKFKDIAQEAAECHASQMGGRTRTNFRQWLYRVYHGHTDTYMRAYPEVNGQRLREKDLFEDILPLKKRSF